MNLKCKNRHCTSLFAQEVQHYLPWALFRFTVHASSSCSSQTKIAQFKQSFFLILLVFDCFSVGITKLLSQNQEADPYCLRNNRSFCIDHCTSDRKAQEGENSTFFTQQSPCRWGHVGKWLQVNSKKKRDLKSCFPNQLHPVTVLVITLSTRELRLKCIFLCDPDHLFSVLG